MFRVREAGMGWGAAVRIELDDAERSELRARARRRRIARADAMRAEIVLLAADGMTNLAIAERLGITRVTVANVAPAVCGEASGRAGRRAPPRGSAHHRRREDRRGGDGDAGDDADRRDALEHALDGQGDGRIDLDRASHLAGVLAAAAPERDLQAVDRPAVRGEGP